MKRCSRCVMPDTWEGIEFDEDGICNICRSAEKKVAVDWDERQNMLVKSLNEYRQYAIDKGNKYNCLVGYSGGKDSAYTLWASVVKYGMRPLVFSFEHFSSLSSVSEYNLMEIPKKLDCDHIRFTIGTGLRNALCRSGSEINGDFCWFCHNGIGAMPARVSKQWDIPLQIWGEPTGAEYQTTGSDYSYDELEEQDREHFERIFQATLKPEKVLPEGYELTDLLPMAWPEGEFPLKAIYLGNYEPWNQRKQVDIIKKELGWKPKKAEDVEGTYVDWDKVDCPFEPVRDWQKFIKRGFGRTTFQASKDIRDGLLDRAEALKLVEALDGKRPKALDLFLEETQMTEEEFNAITRRHTVNLMG